MTDHQPTSHEAELRELLHFTDDYDFIRIPYADGSYLVYWSDIADWLTAHDTALIARIRAALPEKKTKPDDDCEGKDYSIGIMAGYNACLDAVLQVLESES